MSTKAIGLLSGGLDSTLAVKVIQEQGIEVIALNFMSPFCACTSKNAGCKSEAVKVSNEFGLKIKCLYHGEEYLEMLRKPRHGYGRALNPCIDCRIMMFKKAGEYMREVGASFVFTGEVIGQRPMSQRRDTMRVIEKESGLEGYILRPLCARLMPETIPEKEGIVDREKLLKINGRSRKEQIRLAGEYHIEDFPCSSGGCLLTEKGFAGKVKDLLDHSGVFRVQDARLLRIGRHFRLSDHCRVILGRDETENTALEKSVEPGDLKFILAGHNGPFGLARGTDSASWAPLISRIVVRYSSAPKDEAVEVKFSRGGEGSEESLMAQAISESQLDGLRIKSFEHR
ncbi:MAG: hypothetical protein HZA01_07360 [Nitrospinae bacterium]|nr:hypothetical protein [Nitrospinota bacterium]